MIPITLDELKVTDTYEMGFLFDHEVIISYARIIKESLPEGFYAYDIRHDDEGEPCELAPHILANWFATIITNKKIDVDFDRYFVDIIVDDNNGDYDLEYMETIADMIYEEGTENDYAWNIEGYIQRSEIDDFRDHPYTIPQERLLDKENKVYDKVNNGSTEYGT